VCSPSGIDGGARVCCGGEAIILAHRRVVEVLILLLQMLFLPLVVGDSGMERWILFLQSDSGSRVWSSSQFPLGGWSGSIWLADGTLLFGFPSLRWCCGSSCALLACMPDLMGLDVMHPWRMKVEKGANQSGRLLMVTPRASLAVYQCWVSAL